MPEATAWPNDGFSEASGPAPSDDHDVCRVCVRVRPRAGSRCIVQTDRNSLTVLPSGASWEFSAVYGPELNAALFAAEGRPLLASALAGYNATLIACALPGSRSRDLSLVFFSPLTITCPAALLTPGSWDRDPPMQTGRPAAARRLRWARLLRWVCQTRVSLRDLYRSYLKPSQRTRSTSTLSRSSACSSTRRDSTTASSTPPRRPASQQAVAFHTVAHSSSARARCGFQRRCSYARIGSKGSTCQPQRRCK